MSLVRDLGMTLPAMVDTVFVTCSAIISTAGSTAPTNSFAATADALVSATTALTTGFGLVIDRLADPLGTLYNVAMPAARYTATLGSTQADRQMQLGVKLQHGDSSGGGDMADYSTANQPADRTYFGTGRTCDMLNWEFAGRSTGTLHAASNPAYYDLRAAKRYIRVAVRIAKDRVTTESSGDERGRLGAAITFLAAADIPQNADNIKSPFSTTTSTA
jgi:hypothetical protein